MKQKLDKELCAKYPKIFSDRHESIMMSCMPWGFDHGDGWFNIIDRLCMNIQSYIDWKKKQKEPVDQVIATQVKEKFGTLRFYYNGGDDYISGLVAMADSMSGVTCEICGNSGEANDEGWISTLCKTHRDEQE